jgi:hypothetical protein
MNVEIAELPAVIPPLMSIQNAIALLPRTVTIKVGDYNNEPFEVTFKADGSATARDVNCDEEVEFTWDPTILEASAAAEIDEVLSDHAHEVFWDEINEQLGEERLLRDDEYSSGGLVFQNGNKEDLEKVVRLILYSFPSVWEDSRDEIDVMIRANTDNEHAYLEPDYGLMEDPDVQDEVKNSIGALVALALSWNEPYGWSLEYNDGASGRASGYYDNAETVDYTIPKPSFHELAEAHSALLAAFAEHDLADEAKELLPKEEA